MASRNEEIADKANNITVVTKGGDGDNDDNAPRRVSRLLQLPRPLRFPLLLILSLSSSVLLSWLAIEHPARELVAISRGRDEWWWVLGALLGWRIVELGLGWFGNYDGDDLAALSLLSHGPPLYLLAAFYNISLPAVLSLLAINILTTYIPFRLLRPLSPAHAFLTPSESGPILNREILMDLPIQTLITILVAGIYSVALSIAYASYLPTALVAYFNNIPSTATAQSSTPITLLPLAFVLGLAVRSFIFTPATTSMAGAKAPAFNPTTATLAETFRYNFWNYSPRTKVVIKRTATLMFISGINTFLQLYITIEGVEALGAAAYAGVWVTAAFVAGLSLGLVGNV